MANNKKETDQTFLMASIKERILFSLWNEKQDDFRIVKFSRFDDKSAKWDVSFYSGGCYYIAEIKCRNYNSFDYDDWIIDKKKWTDLDSIRNEYDKDCNIQICYINIFPDDRVGIWQLDELDSKDLRYRERTGRKKTCGQDNSTSIHKEYFLPVDKGTFYNFELPSFYDLYNLQNNYIN